MYLSGILVEMGGVGVEGCEPVTASTLRYICVINSFPILHLCAIISIHMCWSALCHHFHTAQPHHNHQYVRGGARGGFGGADCHRCLERRGL